MAEQSEAEMESPPDLYPYLGGLKVAAQVIGLAVHYPTRTVAIAVSRLDGDIWDGCLELWDLSVLDQSKTFASASTKGCVGRYPLPCGVGCLKWLGSEASSAGTVKPLIAIGRDDGNVDVVEWDARNGRVNLTVSLTDHDDMVNSLATTHLDPLVPNYNSLLASGSSDGTVKLWNIAGPNPSSPIRVLEAPFGGASVQAITCASWASGLDVILIAYGGSSGEKGPGIGLYDCSQGLLEPSNFTFLHTAHKSTNFYIDACASPLSICYSKDPLRSHEFMVGFDDGTMATYSDINLSQGPLSVLQPHGEGAAITHLETSTILRKVKSNTGDNDPSTSYDYLVLSASEDCSAMITPWGERSSTVEVVDKRDDYLQSLAHVTGPQNCQAVLTGGLDGQVRLIDISRALH